MVKVVWVVKVLSMKMKTCKEAQGWTFVYFDFDLIFILFLYNFIFAFSLKGWDIRVEMVLALAGLIYGGSSGLKVPIIYFT